MQVPIVSLMYLYWSTRIYVFFRLSLPLFRWLCNLSSLIIYPLYLLALHTFITKSVTLPLFHGCLVCLIYIYTFFEVRKYAIIIYIIFFLQWLIIFSYHANHPIIYYDIFYFFLIMFHLENFFMFLPQLTNN